MENPFLKRTTELLVDDEAFLAIVSPEPVRHFLGRPGQDDLLYDRLVVIRGTPGSGKTTLARLFVYPTLAALLRNRSMDIHRPLTVALTECRAISDQTPLILGCRLPLETDYRDFWEFPYPDELKLGLMTSLIQARAVLTWIRNLTTAGINLSDIKIIPRPGAYAATDAIGGVEATDVVKRARAVELSIYRIVGSLVAPEISQLDEESTTAYRPFDVIDKFEIAVRDPYEIQTLILRPLVILDDAHTLHPVQFRNLQQWLTRRELRVARWVLTRLDVLHPSEALAAITEDRSERVDLPGITANRDTTEIMLQSSVNDRSGQRRAFRRMAKDMANRYLSQMSLFSKKNLSNLSNLLSTQPPSLSTKEQKQLSNKIDDVRNSLSISETRCSTLLEEVDKYLSTKGDNSEDIRLAMLRILMFRYTKRTPQRTLFDDEIDIDPDPSRPLSADNTIYDAGRIHLLHEYNRPYYYGIDELCDASSENAEQFLRLAAILVDAIAAQLIRGKPASLDAVIQHKLIRQRATEIIDAWDYPQHQLVRRIVTTIADRCLEVSLSSNAWLGAGANAYGIRQQEFDQIPDKYPDLARVLQFGIAYNAFTVVPRYQCKQQEWCLLELGGMVILHHGLTLKRGGFLEGTARELAKMVQDLPS